MLRDAVIAGHDREQVAASPGSTRQARRVRRRTGDVALDDPCCATTRARLAKLNAARARRGASSGSSCSTTPPDLDAGEITDKGYVNQRAVLERRAHEVARLFAEPPDAAVITAAARSPRSPAPA